MRRGTPNKLRYKLSNVKRTFVPARFSNYDTLKAEWQVGSECLTMFYMMVQSEKFSEVIYQILNVLANYGNKKSAIMLASIIEKLFLALQYTKWRNFIT